MEKTYSKSDGDLFLVATAHSISKHMHLHLPPSFSSEQVQSSLENTDMRLDPVQNDVFDLPVGEEGSGLGEDHGEFGFWEDAE